MASPTDILNKLQSKVFFKNHKVKARDVEEISIKKPLSTRYTDDKEDDFVDVPDVHSADPGDYTTHHKIGLPGYTSRGNRLPLEGDSVEEIEKPEAPDEMDPEAEEVPTAPEGGDEMAAGVDPAEMGDPAMGGDMGADPAMGGDPGMGGDMGMGMGMEEEPKEPKELGRIYELKKIYARLTSVESYLSDASEPDLLRLRTIVSQSIEMFEILASNFDSYKERLDEIIIMYYKFLDVTYDTLREYYKRQSEET